MNLIQQKEKKPLKLQLRRDLVRTIKRGHAWVYAEALREMPKAQPGRHAILFDNRGGREIARGFYDPDGAIALRVCTTRRGESLTSSWAHERMRAALTLRQKLFAGRAANTTGYRLFNGEGDGLPGLVCDVYGRGAVLVLDGEAAGNFWDAESIATWVASNLDLSYVYRRVRTRSGPKGHALFGTVPERPWDFRENDMCFVADPVNGQKTGFFLDQRENRTNIRQLSSGANVLDVFGYTGGFSVAAGLGGATSVTTVDRAAPALRAAEEHWRMNNLSSGAHTLVEAGAFEFLNQAIADGQVWDLVVLDPPSFAPSKEALPKALAAYQKLIADGTVVTAPEGILAAASCSSHVNLSMFMDACEKGVSQARRRATVLGVYGQPGDHPAPLAMPELRYLKFVCLRIDG